MLAALVCLRLAVWQFDRSEEADGTVQNLGYAVLWPLFGVAFVYMWIRFLMLERQRAAVESAAHDEALEQVLAEADAITLSATPTVAQPVSPDPPVETSRIVDDGIDDPELIAYNRALAALAEEDRRGG